MDVKRIYFVRHAKALDREDWDRPDERRPLSEAGQRQAQTLAQWLRREPIERVVSSRASRCVDTVRPLAAALGLPVRRHDALFEGSSAQEALALMRRLRGGAVVLCTHGDVMQNVLELLQAAGADLGDGMQLAKGAYWTFEMRAGDIRSARYHPAPR